MDGKKTPTSYHINHWLAGFCPSILPSGLRFSKGPRAWQLVCVASRKKQQAWYDLGCNPCKRTGRLTTKQCFKNDWEICVFWKGLRDFHQILVCFSNLFLRWNLFQQPILENMAYDKPFTVNKDTLQKVKNWRNHVFVTIQSDLQKSGIHSP